MLRLSSRLALSDDTIALADSITSGGHALETLGQLMESKELATLIMDMSPANISLGNIMYHLDAASNVSLQLELSFLCGVRRVWKQCVIDGSQIIPYRMMEIAGFAGVIMEPSALQRVMPLPEGGVYDFLMRIRSDNPRRSGAWFQYILCIRESLPPTGINDICRAILEHPDVTVSVGIIQGCIDTSMPIDVYSGDVIRRTLFQCTIPPRRRLRCGTRVESSRSVSLAKLIRSWIAGNAYVAILVRDLVVHDILTHPVENTDFELLGDILLETQIRIPFVPLSEEDIAALPFKVQDSSKTWSEIMGRIRRLPSITERVEHPIWKVRRHF
tara:strand:- start:7597 stop:8583 length:987 start_codon:yes stop_codon:yes gene_type:complete